MRRVPLFLLLLFFLQLSVAAQTTVSPANGFIIDSAQNILGCPTDSGQIQIGSIQFEGNKTTQEKILQAELDLKAGDLINATDLRKRLAANQLRLYNLQLFHWVRYIALCENGKLNLIFTLQERWYIWPVPIFSLADRNFNAWLYHHDWRRIDYGVHLLVRNFRGLNETLRMNVQHGYNRKYELFYIKPRVSHSKIGATFGVSLYRSHALDYTTQFNQPITLRQDDKFPIQRVYVSSGLLYRPNVQQQTTLSLAYNWQQISDEAFNLNSSYYLGWQKRQFAEINLVHTRNYRNTFSYPLMGSFFQVAFAQRLYGNKSGNASTSLRVRYSRYIPLTRNLFYSMGLDGKSTLSRRLAFADNQSLGFGSVVVRGYQLYVVGGQQYGLFKQGLSRNLLPQREVVLDFIKSPKFNRIPLAIYVNAFTDAGYARDEYYAAENSFANRLLMSAGIGLHLVTYYDKVVTLEYTLTKTGQTGFFVTTGIPF
ncbi:BamA/TamA family outer membrane protein [Adhaeribacter radiodurans]|uniref:BamA/TamA family outer membrane protein n=1 Tax=Adhaeribacter radiodurans TaxID=2745197 RepID=A0A7L7L2H3_9BACT|nr:BamA/TamA family outer membrane protein [Adhaeribacter radiodurans]QMU26991.1 BamA/TamA family outer membrane protein [Adhaeribacter radiodurans]